MDKAQCDTMSGNAKDVCKEEAKGKEKVAKAEADAAYKNTPKAREAARIAHADATYNVAKEKCDDLSGNQKDVCVKEA
jgi:regulator of protease activity HflC (stomatin/prohibitin superfamily)